VPRVLVLLWRHLEAALAPALAAEIRLSHALKAVADSGRRGGRLGCLGCKLTGEYAELALNTKSELEVLARQAASYATQGSLAGCGLCGCHLDVLCEAGLYQRSTTAS
jgi:hypothetical protein